MKMKLRDIPEGKYSQLNWLMTSFVSLIFLETSSEDLFESSFSLSLEFPDSEIGANRHFTLNLIADRNTLLGDLLIIVSKSMSGMELDAATEIAWTGLTLRWAHISAPNTELIETENVQLRLEKDSDELNLEFSFSAPLQRLRNVNWSCDHFVTLLTKNSEKRDQPISHLQIFGKLSELGLLQNEFAVTHEDLLFSANETLLDMLQKTTLKFPNKTAIEFQSKKLSFLELDQYSTQFSHQLFDAGARAGTFVGLYLERSLESFVAMIGVLKSGAAYVPIDSGYPQERADFILRDCQAVAVVTHKSLLHKLEKVPCQIIVVNSDLCIEVLKSDGPENLLTGPKAHDLAYVIYTSGSTGQPKGVMIEHASVCHFIGAETLAFKVLPQDRIYQGFSHSFDASIEEIWLGLSSGATLVVADQETVFRSAELASFLSSKNISIFSTVPTVLSMMHGTLNTVRLLILGGESLPKGVLQKWIHPGLRVVNTYGPTEATVVATFADYNEEFENTIGRPLTNVTCYILDSRQMLVPIGATGELFIGGPGLARGYLNDKIKTDAAFLSDTEFFHERLYKTGDLVRMNSTGQIEFIGRKDSQIKIRGYRVETNEIEAALMSAKEIATAVVLKKKSQLNIDQLVAYIVLNEKEHFNREAVDLILKNRLPSYMIPEIMVLVNEIPLLVSGKTDTNKLQTLSSKDSECEKPQNILKSDDAIEQALITAWGMVFSQKPQSLSDDFFSLGGHSLLAAELVSHLRQQDRFRSLSIGDIYHYPSIEKLASHIKRRADFNEKISIASENRTEPRGFNGKIKFSFAAIQLVALYGLFAVVAYSTIGYFLGLDWILNQRIGWIGEIFEMAILGLIPWPILLTFSILTKWILIGKFKPGRYPLWGNFYLRFWLVRRIESLAAISLLTGTPLLNWYCRAMGAKIGRHVFIDSDVIHVYDLLKLDDFSSIGNEAQASGYSIKNGYLIIGSIEIGKHSSIGTMAVMSPNTRLGDDAGLAGLSFLAEGLCIRDGETWAGSPAQQISGSRRSVNLEISSNPIQSVLVMGAHLLGFGFLSLILTLSTYPLMRVFEWATESFGLAYALLTTPFLAGLFILFFSLQIIAAKWLLFGRQRPRHFAINSAFYLRKWFVDLLLKTHLETAQGVYGTVYINPFLRALGAKIGKGVEISTASHISPDLLSIGDESFVADAVSLGATSYHSGFGQTDATTIGSYTFIGNSAFVPSGESIANNCLVGCLSTPPFSPIERMIAGSSWLGSPAIRLPNRARNSDYSPEVISRPTPSMMIARASIEYLRMTLPIGFAIVIFSLTQLVHEFLQATTTNLLAITLLPLAYFAICILGASVVIAMKWFLIGKFKSGEHPLWSLFIWLNELITGLHDGFAAPLFVDFLVGTPFIAIYLRALGCKIGMAAYIETVNFTEFDLVHIGDHAEINLHATIQTHLFEDRVFKLSDVHIGERCCIGPGSIVLYDAEMCADSSIAGLSLLMKSESLPEKTAWEGIPVSRRTESIPDAELNPAEAFVPDLKAG